MRTTTIGLRQLLRIICDIFVVLICYVPMAFGMEIVYIAKIVSCMILAATIMGMFMYLLKGKKPSVVIVGILGFAMWNLLSTVRSGGNLTNALVATAEFITIPMYFLVFRCSEKKAASTLKIWGSILFCYVVIDLLTILIFPKGLYATSLYRQNWFLGYKTERMNIVLSMLIIVCYQSLANGGRWWALGLFCIAIVDAFLCQGMTMVAAYLTFAFCYLVLRFVTGRKTKLRFFKKASSKRLYEFLDMKTVLLVYAVVVFTLLTLQMNPLYKTIVGWFGKNTTISGRDHIWAVCLAFIQKSPIFGQGFVSGRTIKKLTGFLGGTNAHNAVLTVLMTGGIVGLSLYAFILCWALRTQEKTNVQKYALLLSAEIAILVTGLTSSIVVFQSVSLFPVILAEYEQYMCRKSNTLKEKNDEGTDYKKGYPVVSTQSYRRRRKSIRKRPG